MKKSSTLILLSILCIALASATLASRPVLTSENSKQLLFKSGQKPLVKGWGFANSLFNVNGWGISYKFTLDALVGFEAPFSHVSTPENFILANPIGYVEFANHFYIDISFGLLTFRIRNDLTGYRYNFFDLAYLQSIDDYTKYCSQIDYSTTGFKNVVSTEELVKECQYGLFGTLVLNTANCRNMRYIPTQPIWQKQYSDKYDFDGTYKAYACNK